MQRRAASFTVQIRCWHPIREIPQDLKHNKTWNLANQVRTTSSGAAADMCLCDMDLCATLHDHCRTIADCQDALLDSLLIRTCRWLHWLGLLTLRVELQWASMPRSKIHQLHQRLPSSLPYNTLMHSKCIASCANGCSSSPSRR